ncbi:uncharacterized protein (TIGR00106 family) [Geomicrobium halophilum]|uniref:Uncharacterized protein (TIGR00106 family) n=1 Tax=Geomicrobium halophilum TaxID=549000 RepID=A0A841PWE4_9BACL|nr:MTH1187 family thiamine-binding protein [Geomicrobium halophilum]MBB6448282.1 uncharacterized protein (TIGR00106 family) [Geomicrobium halophilum]
MAMADISIVPIVEDKKNSLGAEVAAIHEELDKHKDKIRYELTPMSTIIEGDIDDLFPVIQALHKVTVERGWSRISTDIRIDDRRDGNAHTLEEKKERVNQFKS